MNKFQNFTSHDREIYNYIVRNFFHSQKKGFFFMFSQKSYKLLKSIKIYYAYLINDFVCVCVLYKYLQNYGGGVECEIIQDRYRIIEHIHKFNSHSVIINSELSHLSSIFFVFLAFQHVRKTRRKFQF